MIIKTDVDTMRSYFEDSSNLKGGHADKVLIPESYEEVVSCLKEADSNKVPITISAGGTATTGSRVPFGGIVISMERLNKILSVSEQGMVAIVQAGVSVEDLKNACEKKGLFYTSHPTEKAAFVGATISTNASGARSFKYGPIRNYVKRLKMILPSGEVLDVRRGGRILTLADSIIQLDSGRKIEIKLPTYKMPKVKSAAGYFAKDGMDLIDLFIGQEGTLSVIVEAEVGLEKKPTGIFSCFVFFRKAQDAWSFSDEARRLSRQNHPAGSIDIDALSIEYFDYNALRLLRNKSANVPHDAEAAIFFEQQVPEGASADKLADLWLRIIMKHGVSLDNTWVAMNEKEARAFSEFRYFIPESINDLIRRGGFQKVSTDIAVPDEKFLEMMNFYTRTFAEEKFEHVIFGHIGESHVHTNILPAGEEDVARARQLALKFIKKAVLMGGTVSAEHGIGKIKHRFLEEMYSMAGILEMARIKKAFDPNCILGLDNIFGRDVLKLV